MDEQIKELVRFIFEGTLIRITRETGFEHQVDGQWVKTQDVKALFHGNANAGLAMHSLIMTASELDAVEPDMGKQVFLAAIRTEGMQRLGFRDAVLN